MQSLTIARLTAGTVVALAGGAVTAAAATTGAALGGAAGKLAGDGRARHGDRATLAGTAAHEHHYARACARVAASGSTLLTAGSVVAVDGGVRRVGALLARAPRPRI